MSPHIALLSYLEPEIMAGKFKIGDAAPDFRLMAVGGKYGGGQEVSLSDFLGEPLVLYFYPKDDTPGCTAQACGLRDAWSEIKGRAAIFGVSVDPIKSHERFIKKFQLPFPLLADSEKKMVAAYGVWVEKSFLGKKYMGTERTTFVIDRGGRISAIFRKVKPGEHVDLIQSALNKNEK
jgi:thioredoxin-dependent peroxiredoxin